MDSNRQTDPACPQKIGCQRNVWGAIQSTVQSNSQSTFESTADSIIQSIDKPILRVLRKLGVSVTFGGDNGKTTSPQRDRSVNHWVSD